MRQARTRAGQVVLSSGKQLLLHSSQFHVWVNVNDFNSVFYSCPQVINDVDCNLFGACDFEGFESAEIKEEGSLDCSNCIKNEGNHAVLLSLVLYCVNIR